MRFAFDPDHWKVRGFLGDEWRQHRVWDPGPLREPSAWLPARVPGSVVDDLWRAGAVPDPYAGLNTRAAEWVADRHWVYRYEFSFDLGTGWLCLDGVDHAAFVYLDGVELGRVEGMFVPARFDVSSLLRERSDHHVLVIVVEPAPVSEPQVGHTSKVRVHKSRMTYGWDFCPRLPHQGIWQPVYLAATPPANLHVRTTLAGDGTARVIVQGATGEVVLTDADGTIVASAPSTPEEAGTGTSAFSTPEKEGGGSPAPAGGEVVLRVPAPRLWWPNGHGEPYLYRLTVDGNELDVGIRTLEFAGTHGIVVNGRQIFAKGWNWVPLDLLYGVPRPERLEHLLDLAADAGVNLLRVWGGGLIETPWFYEGCDRRGILVWQEFSQSSSGMESTPAGDPAYVAMMREQAEQIVPRLRNHPSLTIWAGGNELGGSPVLGALEEVVRRLDPERLWLPSSPWGTEDVHGPWEHQGLREHYGLYDAGTAHLVSEFGVEGMTHDPVLARVVPEPERRMPTRGRPVWDHLGRWWNNESLVQECFGNRIRDLGTLGMASQFLQRDGLQYAVEAARRRAFQCVGTLPWQFNEPYPNAWCTAAVAHSGEPKPVYYGVTAAYGPLIVGAVCGRQSWHGFDELHLPLWMLSEHALEMYASVEFAARLLDLDGKELARYAFVTVEGRHSEVWREPGTAGDLGTLRAAVPDGPFVVDLRLSVDAMGNDPVEVGRRYLLTGSPDLGSLLDLDITVDAVYTPTESQVLASPPGSNVASAPETGVLTVRHVSGPIAPFVRITDTHDYDPDRNSWLRLSDNGFSLLPGETRHVTMTNPHPIRLDGFGITPQTIPCA